MIVKKKEAHRMLSNIKVYVGGKSKEIQMKLFEAGFDWDYNKEKEVRHEDAPFLYTNGDLILYGKDMIEFKGSEEKNMTAEEILNISIELEAEVIEIRPFDKVLVRSEDGAMWNCDLFSHHVPSATYPFICIGDEWDCCIPYNEETRNLVGTCEDVPERYARASYMYPVY